MRALLNLKFTQTTKYYQSFLISTRKPFNGTSFKVTPFKIALPLLSIDHICELLLIAVFGVPFVNDNTELSDKLKNVSAVKAFDANVNATPEVSSVKKLYRNS